MNYQSISRTANPPLKSDFYYLESDKNIFYIYRKLSELGLSDEVFVDNINGWEEHFIQWSCHGQSVKIHSVIDEFFSVPANQYNSKTQSRKYREDPKHTVTGREVSFNHESPSMKTCFLAKFIKSIPHCCMT